LIFLFILPLTWIVLHLVLRSKPIENPMMLAHRGAAGLAPENTLISIQEAIHQGAKSIEVDVQRSADGVLVLMHDQTVNRTTDGTGKIGELTWSEISKLDAGGGFSSQFAGEPVPSLDSVLELIKEQDVTLVLEAKKPSLYPGIERQIAEALQQSGLNKRTIVVSLAHGWLERFNEWAPDISTGYLWVACPLYAPRIPTARTLNVHWANVILDPTLVRRMHRQGYQLWVWTVNDVRLMRLLIWLGVDAITTDHPEVWPEVIGTR
jgi:glycerophosphoryl diester phosphodiesterase